MTPFIGETMTCLLCGAMQRSDPEVSSNWRALQIEGRIFYACTDQ